MSRVLIRWPWIVTALALLAGAVGLIVGPGVDIVPLDSLPPQTLGQQTGDLQP